MVQIYYEIRIYIYKEFFPLRDSPLNPHRGMLSPEPPLGARLPPDPPTERIAFPYSTGGVTPPAIPHVEECTLFQGEKSSWGIKTAEKKDL
jgi:hypothetical protein